MQSGEHETENDQQQNQMKSLADALQDSPDETKETRKSGPDAHSMPPGRPADTAYAARPTRLDGSDFLVDARCLTRQITQVI